jgi:hypothetical protein
MIPKNVTDEIHAAAAKKIKRQWTFHNCMTLADAIENAANEISLAIVPRKADGSRSLKLHGKILAAAEKLAAGKIVSNGVPDGIMTDDDKREAIDGLARKFAKSAHERVDFVRRLTEGKENEPKARGSGPR